MTGSSSPSYRVSIGIGRDHRPAGAPPVFRGPRFSTASDSSTRTRLVAAWGDPDLQGLWPGVDMVEMPVQPAQFGTRNVLTDEEFAQRIEKSTLQYTATIDDPGTRTRP